MTTHGQNRDAPRPREWCGAAAPPAYPSKYPQLNALSIIELPGEEDRAMRRTKCRSASGGCLRRGAIPTPGRALDGIGLGMKPAGAKNRAVDRFVLPTAVGVVSAAIWWIVTQSWVAAVASVVVVGVAAVLAWRILPLVARLRVFDDSEIAEIYQNQAYAEKEIKRMGSEAKNIDILTIRGLGIIGLNDSVLRKQLLSGAGPRRRIRILLLSPDGKNARARAAEIGESPEAFVHGINLSIQRMKEIADLRVHDVEVYLYDRRPTWRIIALDSNYFVSAFGLHVEGHRALMYRVDGTKRSTLFDALSRMFDEMCDTGERIV